MICKIQVVTLGEDGRQETREIACLERTDLKPETLGLTLAELLPDRTLPELLFLETKWASLMSYGMTSKLLQEVLPIDEPVNTFTLRQHATEVAERLERELGDERFCFIEGCQHSWDQLPAPDGPLTVGIDGGYVRGQRKQGSFEVIVGKSLLAFKREEEGEPELSARCFGWVQTYDEKPKRCLFELLQAQGMQRRTTSLPGLNRRGPTGAE